MNHPGDLAEEKWTDFSLFHVRYPEGDPIGFILAGSSYLPFLIFTSYITLILFKKEVDTVMLMIGQLGNEVANIILKHVLKQGRPHRAYLNGEKITSYGMPSQHSQFMGYFAGYTMLFILFKTSHKPWYFRLPCIIIPFLLLIPTSYSRVYLQYHYWSQVVTGNAIGLFLSCGWFMVVTLILEPYVYPILIDK